MYIDKLWDTLAEKLSTKPHRTNYTCPQSSLENSHQIYCASTTGTKKHLKQIEIWTVKSRYSKSLVLMLSFISSLKFLYCFT